MKARKILLTMFALYVCLAAHAYDAKINGIYYNISENQATVTFQDNSNGTYTSDYAGDIVIPETITYNGDSYSVTRIGQNAFDGCSSVTSIVIPESVNFIGPFAFNGCSGLTTLTVPESVNSIYDGAFDGCTELKTLVLPENVNYMYSSFKNCSSLTSLKIPNGVENIYEKTLSGCSSLQSLSISGSVRYIYAKAFDDCRNLKELRLEDGTSNLNLNYSWRSALGVGGHAFYRCPLESVYLGRGLIYDSDREYGYSPFYNKTNLTNVTIGNNVTIISSNLFRSCTGLTSITIPDNVKTIGESAFYGCSSLNNLQWSEGLEKIMKDAFSDCSNLPSVTFPNTLTTIGDRAFIGCNAFTSIFIPANVTSIGFAAFARCPNIISMVVTDENSFYDSRYSCNAIIETATNKLIAGCQNTVIPQTVETIYDRAFLGCTSLTTIVIPESVTSIGSYAFQDCTGLTSVKVKIATPLSIDSNTFANQANATLYVPQGCKSAYEAANYWKEFKEIKEFIRDGSYSYIASNGLRWNFKLHDEKATLCGYYDDSDGTISCCVTGNLPSTLVIPSIVKVAGSDVGLPVVGIDDWAFCETSSDDSYTYFDNVTSIFIPSGIKYISGNAFVYYYSRNLTKVEFASIESFLNIRFGEYSNPLFIAHHLYINGSEVNNLVIPNSITSINEYAFQGCYGMTSVTIPNSVTSIGSYAFESCSGLTSINIPEGVTSIGRSAFYGCSGLTSINIPEGVTSISQSAFRNCSSLTSIDIPNSVTSIGNYAFSGCSGLISVTVNAETPITITSDVFSNRTNATLYVPAGCKEVYEAADYWKEFKEIIENIEFIPGDINSDNAVDVSDYMTIANYILGQAPTTFNEAAADVTQDSNVDVADYMGVANIILFGNYQGPQANSANGIKALEAEQTSPWMGMEVTEDGLVELLLHDTPTFSAFQMDISLPEGIEIYEANMSKTKQTRNLSYAQLQSGAWRLLYGTMDGKTVNLADHSLLTLKLTSKNKEAFGDIDVEGITLVRPNTSVMHLSGVHGTLPTGISDIESMMPAEANCYDLTGRKVTESHLKKGIFIINGKKVAIK